MLLVPMYKSKIAHVSSMLNIVASPKAAINISANSSAKPLEMASAYFVAAVIL